PTGQDLGPFTTALSGMGSADLAFDSQGNVYVAASYMNLVEKISPTGQDLGRFINIGLNNPKGLVFDAQGNLYVSNYASNTIEKFNSTGQDQGVLATGLNGPQGLAVDAHNSYLYVTTNRDTLNGGTVERIPLSGGGPVILASGLATPAYLAFPSDQQVI